MSKSPVSLSVHRNTVEGRRKRELAVEVARQTASLIREKDIRAYAFVGVGSDGGLYALWDTGGVMPMRAFSACVGQAISDDIHNSEAVEDWKPPLR